MALSFTRFAFAMQLPFFKRTEVFGLLRAFLPSLRLLFLYLVGVN